MYHFAHCVTMNCLCIKQRNNEFYLYIKQLKSECMKCGNVRGLAYHYTQNPELPSIPAQEVRKVSGSTKP